MGGRREHDRPHALRRPGRHVPAGLLRRVPARPAAAGAAAPLPGRRRPLAPARERLPDPQRERRARRARCWPRAPERAARRSSCPGSGGGAPRAGRRVRARRRRRAAATCSAATTPTCSGSRSRPRTRRASRSSGAAAPRRPPATSGRSSRSCAAGTSSSSSPRAGRRPTGRSARSGPGSARSSAAGKPRAIRPLALAYDPLVRGRTRVHLALGEPVEPPPDDVEGALLALLRLTMPLTCGQVVAARLRGRRGRRPPRARARLARRRRGRARGGPAGRARPGDGRRPPSPARRGARGGPAPGRRAAVPRPRVRERARALASARFLGGLAPPAEQAREGRADRIAPMIVTGRTASACIVSTYAVALSGLTSMPFAARSVR